MILKYYGGNISIEKLNNICKITSDGISAYHLIKAAEKIGLNAVGMKCEFKYLITEKIKLPIIAHVTLNHSFLHYIVIYEINLEKKYLLIADPSSHIKKILFKDFIYIYNDTIITFDKQNVICSENNTLSLNDTITEIIINNKRKLLVTLIFSILYLFFSIISTYFIQLLISVQDNSVRLYVIFLITTFTLIYILKFITKYVKNIITIYIMQSIDFDLTTRTYYFILSLPYSYYQNKTIGEIISKINDLKEIKTLIQKLIELFIYFIFSFISIILLSIIKFQYLYIVALIYVMYFCLIIYLVKTISKSIKEYQKNKAKYTSFLVESFANFETIKALHIQNDLQNEFISNSVSYLAKEQKLSNKLTLLELFKELIEIMGFLTCIIFSIFYIKNIGLLFTITYLYTNSILFIKQIVDFIPILKEAKEAINRIKDIFVKEDKKSLYYKPTIRNIICKNLTYTYDDKENILENISFMIEAKSKVLILGKSGVGKSTFFKLLLKYYEVNRNNIFIDDKDICDYDTETLNKSIIYISQNETLFTGTLYDNITLYKEIDENELRKVLKICEIEKILKNNILGFNMWIEEGGKNLSGGEKQRIFLARALLKNFNMLIIDEGLSQLDIKSERRILINLFKYYDDKIILFSSHRIDNLDLFNKIIRFEDKNKIKDIEKNQYGIYKETEYF